MGQKTEAREYITQKVASGKPMLASASWGRSFVFFLWKPRKEATL